jgi:hypothetical protein
MPDKGLPRIVRCGVCIGCTAKECARCANCLDKPCHGGRGVKKKACVLRVCVSPLQPAKAAAAALAPPPQPIEASKGASTLNSPAPPAPCDDVLLRDVLESLLAFHEQQRSAAPCAEPPPCAEPLPPPLAAACEQRTPRVRLIRCGSCDGCKVARCGRCKNCADLPRYGGAGIKKQACVARRCTRPRAVDLTHDSEASHAEARRTPGRALETTYAAARSVDAHRRPSSNLSAVARAARMFEGIGAAPLSDNQEDSAADAGADRRSHSWPSDDRASGSTCRQESTPVLEPSQSYERPWLGLVFGLPEAVAANNVGDCASGHGAARSSLTLLSFVTAQAAEHAERYEAQLRAFAARDLEQYAIVRKTRTCKRARSTVDVKYVRRLARRPCTLECG